MVKNGKAAVALFRPYLHTILGADMRFESKLIALSVAVCGCIYAAHVEAAPRIYHCDLVPGGIPPSLDAASISYNDRFYAQFTIDDSVADSSPADDVDHGGFGNLMTSLKIVSDPSNLGHWHPSQGSWSVPKGWGTNRPHPEESLTYYEVGTTVDCAAPFPPVTINGVPAYLPRVGITLAATINDTGAGQTWAEQVSDLRPTYWQWGIAWGDANDVMATFVVSNFAEGPHPELLPPVADAGADQTVECTSPAGAEVQLDGSGSYDMGDDDLDYEWSVAEDSGIVLEDPTAPVTAGLFPVGVHEVTLTVYDLDEFGVRRGDVDVDSVTVVVVDDIPPVALVTTDLASLWPADNKMTAVTVHVVASDACTSPNDLSILCTVSSDQPDVSRGATQFTGDVNGTDGYSAPIAVQLQRSGDGTYSAVIRLRAERDPGSAAGRTYSINLDVIDDADNLGHASTTVVVPQNQKKK